jgi:hypothetical protein
MAAGSLRKEQTMASTYSTNLKIELIGTGEQSGLWGTKTNTNLGTALEAGHRRARYGELSN